MTVTINNVIDNGALAIIVGNGHRSINSRCKESRNEYYWQ